MIKHSTSFIIAESEYTEELKNIQLANVVHNLKLYIKRKFRKKLCNVTHYVRRNCLYKNIYNDRMQLIEELNFANKEAYELAPFVYIEVEGFIC